MVGTRGKRQPFRDHGDTFGVQHTGSPMRRAFSHTASSLRRWHRKRAPIRLPPRFSHSLHLMENTMVFTILFAPACPTFIALCLYTVLPKPIPASCT